MAELAVRAPERSRVRARLDGGRKIDLTRGEDGWWRTTASVTDYPFPPDAADDHDQRPVDQVPASQDPMTFSRSHLGERPLVIRRGATAAAANLAPHPQRLALPDTAGSVLLATDPGVSVVGEVADLPAESAAVVEI